MSIEAMKQWLEALMAVELHLCEVGQRGNGLHRQVCESITSICMALDQAEKQEPVAYVVTTEVHGQMCSFIHRIDLKKLLPDGALLYNTPQPQREWVGLTDEDVFAAENAVPDEVVTDRDWCVHFARAIEVKLREKNGGGR